MTSQAVIRHSVGLPFHLGPNGSYGAITIALSVGSTVWSGPILTACLYFDGERGVTSMLLGNMMRASPKWPVGTVCLNGIDHPDLDDRALLLQFGSLIDCVHSGVHCRAPGQVRS